MLLSKIHNIGKYYYVYTDVHAHISVNINFTCAGFFLGYFNRKLFETITRKEEENLQYLSMYSTGQYWFIHIYFFNKYTSRLVELYNIT